MAKPAAPMNTAPEIDKATTHLEAEYLQLLRRIAESATQDKWWVTEQPWGDGTSVHAGPSEDPHGQRLSVCMFDVMTEQFNGAFDGVDCDDVEAEGKRNMRHIATFDPPTCIELLNAYDHLRSQNQKLSEACEEARAWICKVSNEYILPDAEPHDVLAKLRAALKEVE